VTGRWDAVRTTPLPAGTMIIRAGQPLGLLAFYLLEPESDDGLASYLGARVAKGQAHPVMRIVAPVTLRTRPTPSR
jgi:dipeptidyl-peptidase 4